MYTGTSNYPAKRESDLLVGLSKASKLLKNCSSEDITVILWDLLMLTRTSADKDGADVSSSSAKDGESSCIEFLVWLLQSRCKVVEHAAAKTLLALSNSLRKTRADAWVPFLHHLWTVAEYWASGPSSNCCEYVRAEPGYEQPSRTNTVGKYLEHKYQWVDECLVAKELVGLPLGGSNLLAASNAIDLLRKILKECLKNSGEALSELEAFLNLFMENIIHLATATRRKQDLSHSSQCLAPQVLATEVLYSASTGDLPRELFLGSVLRLISMATHLATSTSHYCKVEDVAVVGSLLETVDAVLPVVSSSVLAHHVNCEGNNRSSPFLCHKLLMIIMRLSECFDTRPHLALACLNSLHSFEYDLLGFSVLASTRKSDSLDDSPFAASLVQGLERTRALIAPSFKHLQRRAVYILFKIASFMHKFSGSRKGTPVQDVADVPIAEDQEYSFSCALKETSSLLIDWLDRQAQLGLAVDLGYIQEDAFLDQLSKSFVHLFFEEDDLMLKMLLLLSNQPCFLSSVMTLRPPNNSVQWKVAATALKPERLFHSFLAAILYNSSVLVDFLISEDSGALCLLYLMRSFRCITDSWPELVNATPCDCVLDEEASTSLVEPFVLQTHREDRGTDGPQVKRQKGPDQSKSGFMYQSRAGTSDVSRRKGEDLIVGSVNDSQGYGLKLEGSRYPSDRKTSVRISVLQRVMDCLLQLKLSIERLHRRSLFPYNPSALLRRFDAVVKLLEDYLGSEAVLTMPNKKENE